MNILYIHGFGSKFDPSSDKVISLSKLGNVEGIDIDWTRPAQHNISRIIEAAAPMADLIVGTSMGGWGAAKAGAAIGVPFVSINPAVDPGQSLKRYLGDGIDYNGALYSLVKKTVETYTAIDGSGCGLILLDEGDTVIPYKPTVKALTDHYDINTFEGGSHRFEHMEQALPIIKQFYNKASVSYGFDV